MKNIVILAIVLSCAACSSQPQSSTARANVELRSASGSNVHGYLTFTQLGPNRVRLTGEVSGHQPGAKGFHIHEKGDCSSPDAMSAGGHFNPAQRKHANSAVTGHAGDLGNIVFDESGRAAIDMIVEGISLEKDAPNGIVGRAVVVHMQPDDLKTDPTGNAGARAACGVIV